MLNQTTRNCKSQENMTERNVSLLIASFAKFFQYYCVLYYKNVLVTGSVAEKHYWLKENEKPKRVSETITMVIESKNILKEILFDLRFSIYFLGMLSSG